MQDEAKNFWKSHHLWREGAEKFDKLLFVFLVHRARQKFNFKLVREFFAGSFVNQNCNFRAVPPVLLLLNNIKWRDPIGGKSWVNSVTWKSTGLREESKAASYRWSNRRQTKSILPPRTASLRTVREPFIAVQVTWKNDKDEHLFMITKSHQFCTQRTEELSKLPLPLFQICFEHCSRQLLDPHFLRHLLSKRPPEKVDNIHGVALHSDLGCQPVVLPSSLRVDPDIYLVEAQKIMWTKFKHKPFYEKEIHCIYIIPVSSCLEGGIIYFVIALLFFKYFDFVFWISLSPVVVSVSCHCCPLTWQM